MSETKKPNEHQMEVLRNIEAGRDFYYGMSTDIAVPAMWKCIENDWVSRNRLTEKGRAVLTPTKPAKGNVEVTIIKEEKPKPPIPLPPIGGWKNMPS